MLLLIAIRAHAQVEIKAEVTASHWLKLRMAKKQKLKASMVAENQFSIHY